LGTLLGAVLQPVVQVLWRAVREPIGIAVQQVRLRSARVRLQRLTECHDNVYQSLLKVALTLVPAFAVFCGFVLFTYWDITDHVQGRQLDPSRHSLFALDDVVAGLVFARLISLWRFLIDLRSYEYSTARLEARISKLQRKLGSEFPTSEAA
jgi:hypothetical protein